LGTGGELALKKVSSFCRGVLYDVIQDVERFFLRPAAPHESKKRV
jgi:hypothetical protein